MENKIPESQNKNPINRETLGDFNPSHYAFYSSIIDLTTTSPSKEYLDKLEKSIQMYIDLVIKPQYDGLDNLIEIEFNKEKPREIIKGGESYYIAGSTAVDNSRVTINLANLLHKPFSSAIEKNADVFDYFMTAEHEIRHYYQNKLREELKKGALADKDKIEKYKKVFGDKAEEIAYSTEEIITDKHISALNHFLDSNTAHLSNSEYSNLKSQLFDLELFYQKYIYLPSLHEYDARESELNTIGFLRNFLVKNHEFAKFINFSDANISTTDWNSLIEGLKPFTNKVQIIESGFTAFNNVMIQQENTNLYYNQKYKEYKDMLDKMIGNLQPEQIFKFIQDNAFDKNRVQKESDLLMNFKQFKDFFNNEEKVQKLEQLCRQHGLDWVLDDNETTQDNNKTQSIKKPEKETEKLEDEYELEL